jgi:hypothetical protein
MSFRFVYKYGTALTIVLVIVWGLLASAAMIFMPIGESTGAIMRTVANVVACKKIPHDMASDAAMTSKHGGSTWKGQHAKNVALQEEMAKEHAKQAEDVSIDPPAGKV